LSGSSSAGPEGRAVAGGNVKIFSGRYFSSRLFVLERNSGPLTSPD